MPDFSVRIDPLNWILYGQLGIELELEVAEWLTIETVPMFVVSEQPVVFNEADDIYQKGDGLGALAGASLGLGFWLDGDSFNGTVLRPSFNFYSIEYRSESIDGFPATSVSAAVAPGEVVDRATVKQRRLSVMIGSHRTWGFFTLSGGFGVEYELNEDRRCIADEGGVYDVATENPPCRDDDQFVVARTPVPSLSQPEGANLFGPLHPFYIAARLSLGFVLDSD